MHSARILKVLRGYESDKAVPQRIECGWEVMHTIRLNYSTQQDGRVLLHRIDSFSGLPIEMRDDLPPRAFDVVLHSGEIQRHYL